MTPPSALRLLLLVLLGATVLPAGADEQSLGGEVIDHVVLLVPGRAPARFLGPDLHLRELRYATEKAASKEAPVRGKMSFGRQSQLQKKFRALLKQDQEFEMVVYFLAEGKLNRLRFAEVKLVGGEKDLWEWTAGAAHIEPVRETPASGRRQH